MADIVLATLNARYAHTAFGLRCLLSNLGALKSRAALSEHTIAERPCDVLEALLAHAPRIVGLGVYIWNIAPMTELVRLLKAVRPDIIVVLGGPEVSFETTQQEIVEAADYVVCGEGEETFRRLCDTLLHGGQEPCKILPGALPSTEDMPLPYALYTDEDVMRRVVYVEASRGCPYACEFCLSSLDQSVRRVPLERLLPELDILLARGARQFKFIDRTFNLQLSISRAILQFFLDRLPDGLFLHFEMVPDRLPTELRQLIAAFPQGALQFEVGVQTLDPAVEKRIARRQNQQRMADNFAFLREQTGVHVHADLIVGLPGETLATFASGFDRLWTMGPQEIQVGILKRLRGTPIVRHTEGFSMVYNPAPPYEVMATAHMPYTVVQQLKRFAAFWDKLANSGAFVHTLAVICSGAPFERFLSLSEALYRRLGRTHSIAADRLAEAVLQELTATLGVPPAVARAAISADYARMPARRVPNFLQMSAPKPRSKSKSAKLPPRQARHLA